MLDISRLRSSDSNFWSQMKDLLAWDNVSDDSVQSTVRQILKDVRREGDTALLDYTNKFDRMSAADMSVLSIDKDRLQQALDGLPDDQRQALEVSAERVKRYHDKQKMEGEVKKKIKL